MDRKYDVFVSHSSKDKLTANAIVHYLEERKVRCWIAPRDIVAGDEWAAGIMEGIKNCRMLLLIFCENSLKSKQVLREVNQAIKHELPILPFRVENVLPEGAFSYYLDSIHWLDAFDGELDGYLEELYVFIAKIIGVDNKKIEIPTKLTKNDLCSSCQNIRRTMSSGEKWKMTLGEELDHPLLSVMIGRTLHLNLRDDGGCATCISKANKYAQYKVEIGEWVG